MPGKVILPSLPQIDLLGGPAPIPCGGQQGCRRALQCASSHRELPVDDKGIVGVLGRESALEGCEHAVADGAKVGAHAVGMEVCACMGFRVFCDQTMGDVVINAFVGLALFRGVTRNSAGLPYGFVGIGDRGVAMLDWAGHFVRVEYQVAVFKSYAGLGHLTQLIVIGMTVICGQLRGQQVVAGFVGFEEVGDKVNSASYGVFT